MSKKTPAAMSKTPRPLTDAERAAIRANARGEHVFAGTAADAETIARGACDRDHEWSGEARDEAVLLASSAWEASR